MLSGNKGEWSEVYTLLKVIADGRLYQGDGNLNKVESAFLPILKVLRAESDGTYTYETDQNLVVVSGSGVEFKIPILDFKNQAEYLLNKIQTASTASFSVPEIETFISSFNCKSLKAGSSAKSDIRIVLHDSVTGTSPELGFSIKSQLGNASTLLNAGKTTNFIYELQGDKIPTQLVDEINAIKTRTKIKDRLSRIESLNNSLHFKGTANSIFSNNLTLIDSLLPRMLAELVYVFYTTTNSSLISLVNEISNTNPLNFDNSKNHPFYSYKIKRFLTDIALGMMPATIWTGRLEATGGYLVVKGDGEVLSYHIYNRNDFEDYLLNNTKLETASSTRHAFGVIYEKDNTQFFNLNLQIRFTK